MVARQGRDRAVRSRWPSAGWTAPRRWTVGAFSQELIRLCVGGYRQVVLLRNDKLTNVVSARVGLGVIWAR
eukprot:7192518-Lingulodinium_polyedra.AAC.1